MPGRKPSANSPKRRSRGLPAVDRADRVEDVLAVVSVAFIARFSEQRFHELNKKTFVLIRTRQNKRIDAKRLPAIAKPHLRIYAVVLARHFAVAIAQVHHERLGLTLLRVIDQHATEHGFTRPTLTESP